MKPRTEYAYVAYRLDTSDEQNIGDFGIRYQNSRNDYDRQTYHYASRDYHNPEAPFRGTDMLINRRNLNWVPNGGPVYQECMKAIDRLVKEEAEADQ